MIPLLRPMPHSTRRVAALAALALTAVFAVACADDPAPIFEPTGTGEIEGRVYFDADNNTQFTPTGGDTALAGVLVLLRERQDTTVLDSIRTSADGTFEFDGVTPGTHDVFVVRDTTLTPNLVFCVNPAPSSVYIGELAYVAAPAKGGCVIRIRAAKDTTLGRRVTVAGIVTAGQGTFRAQGDNAYIEDPTGGINLFGLPASLALQVGDSIEVTGRLATFGGEIQLDRLSVAPNITRGATPIDPQDVTTGAVLATAPLGGKSPYVGRLLRVSAATVGPFNRSGGGNAALNDGSGEIEIRRDGNVANTLPATFFEEGACYDVVGILGFFNGTFQLKPRGPQDVTEVPCP